MAAVLAVGAVAIVALLSLRPGPHGSPGSGGAQPVPEPAPSAAGTLASDEVLAAGGALPPTATPGTAGATTPGAATRAAPGTAVPAGSPAPFVQTFAAQPGVGPLPAKPSPTAPVTVAPNVDGCDRGYGTRSQCVPWTFPASATDKCAWLAAQGFRALTVHGSDRHRLDPDRNGIACD